jgi:hypothetical protein
MHLYHHPDCANEERSILLSQFPKKIEEWLVVCPERGHEYRLGYPVQRRLELGEDVDGRSNRHHFEEITHLHEITPNSKEIRTIDKRVKFKSLLAIIEL